MRLYLDEGLTVTEISCELGISRQTIYRWINPGGLDRDLEEVRYGPGPRYPPSWTCTGRSCGSGWKRTLN